MSIIFDRLLLESGDKLLLESGDDLLLESFSVSQPAAFTPSPTWTLQLCRDASTIAVCTAFEFSGLLARNKGSDWVLESTEAGIPASGYTDPHSESGLDVPFDPRDVTDIRLIANSRVVYAGDVLGDNAGFFAERDQLGERWRWTGVERGWNTLQSRLAYPDPATEFPWATSHDVRTGLASSVLAEYIDNNAGALALTGRLIEGLDVADEQVGPSLTFSARLTDLASLATRIANDGGFLVIPEHDFDGSITYRLSLARDLSGVIVFSDSGDLLESSARFQNRDHTFVISGGTGEGTSRTFAASTTGAEGRARREFFSDQNNMTSTSELQADADARVQLAGEKFEIATTLADAITSVALDFGLRVGDKLGIVVRKRRYSAPIEAVEFSISPERQLVRPRFGAARPNELVELLDQIDGLSGRLDQQIA